MKSFFLHLYQHTAWALGAFCAFALGFEWLVPNSVTPYLHLVPIAIVSAILLFMDAVFIHPHGTITERFTAFFLPVILSISAFLTYRAPGMINLLAIGLIIVMLFASAGFVFWMKQED